MKNKILCIIPVRKGSKRCKEKNVKPFSSTSLTLIACRQALRLKSYFSEIILSSNDHVAIEQCRTLGNDIAIRHRPKELCGPEASSESAIYDALKWSSKNFDFIYLSEVTSPLRSDKDILESLKLAEIYGCGVKSVCEIKNCITDEIIEPKLQLNGAIHIWKTDWIRDIPYTRFSLHHMPPERSIHIDYDWEFDVAEILYKRMQNEI